MIGNLLISKIEVRSDEAIDVKKYIHDKIIEVIPVPSGPYMAEISDLFYKAVSGPLSIQ